MKTYFPNNFTIPSNSRISGKHSFQLPGGTMAGVVDKWTSTKLSAGTDSIYGRWSWISLQGRNRRTITLISAYCINLGHKTHRRIFYLQTTTQFDA